MRFFRVFTFCTLAFALIPFSFAETDLNQVSDAQQSMERCALEIAKICHVVNSLDRASATSCIQENLSVLPYDCQMLVEQGARRGKIGGFIPLNDDALKQ